MRGYQDYKNLFLSQLRAREVTVITSNEHTYAISLQERVCWGLFVCSTVRIYAILNQASQVFSIFLLYSFVCLHNLNVV